MSPLRSYIKRILPPAIVDFYRSRKATYRFVGAYGSWEEALEDCSGYDDPKVLLQVRDAVRFVLEGGGAYERDGMVFSNPWHDRHFLNGLLLAAAESKGRLSVLDVGGSLGSTFLQYREVLSRLPELRWTVVEQPHFVKAGKELFPDGPVAFAEELEEAAGHEAPNVLLLCSVLPYVRDPYVMLRQAISVASQFLIIDRTAVLPEKDRLTVQQNGPSHFSSSYPAWFLSKRRIYDELKRAYEIVYEYPALESTKWSGIEGSEDIGLVCRRIQGR